MEKIKVALIFGGRSGEHEVSLKSASSIAQTLNKEKYELILIAIAEDGKWYHVSKIEDIINFSKIVTSKDQVTILPYPNDNKLINIEDYTVVNKLDIIFPVLHGTFGEDGTIQGLLELANIPYVGSGVLGSSLGMDKIAMKDVFAHHNLPQVKYTAVLRSNIEKDIEKVIGEISKILNFPLFVKPANLGSSVGITKADSKNDLERSLLEASKYDRKIIVEEGVEAQEIEVSILGNDNPIVSLPGEIIPSNEFYDYQAKYIDNSSTLKIPAQLDEKIIFNIQELAKKAYISLDCAGLARVDFFICKNTEKIYLNEINTMPGFTTISMYPKLFEATGILMDNLLDSLISFGFERYKENNKNITSFELD